MESLVNTDYLRQVKQYATDIIINDFPVEMVFHDFKFVKRLEFAIAEVANAEGVSPEELEKLKIAGWLSFVGFKNFKSFEDTSEPYKFFESCFHCSAKLARVFLETIEYPNTDDIIYLLQNSQPHSEHSNPLTDVLSDAYTIDWSRPKARKRAKKLYQEFLLTDVVEFGKKEWYSVVLNYLETHEYKTNYGKTVLRKRKLEVIDKIRKEKKQAERTTNVALKKELNISDDELKKLQKSLKTVKGRDERGIQTMFRTTSRNHYTLNQMVDRKANIMISINAIILSVIVARIVGDIETFCIHNAPVLLLLLTSLASIVFAILAITPERHHGEFTEEEVRDKKGNLLFFGNYHNMAFRDYQWGMLQMLSDGDYLYTTMIRDQYFLGQQLNKKYRNIRYALRIFLFGLVATIVFFMIVSSMPDFHLGGNH